ncbi:hypothetical protein ACE2AJ_15265 [Aquihabitans daechungensis]|uniref:hypothetical protein n=1 Tax=Aquihabitans daechungensis TaxID=1052257 RepID=UPI003BA24D1A
MTTIDPRTGGSIWWDPREADWWVAANFAVGSTCFILGATPGYESLVGSDADGVTYFVGSLFFTTAAWLQVLVSTGAIGRGIRTRRAARWRAVARAPHEAVWWAGIVQFAGTLCFNVSTLLALQHSLTAKQADHRVWAPDFFGSIAFLVASALAYAAVSKPWVTWRPKDLDWSVATLNMVGSVAFMASALAAYVIEDGSLRNAELANAGTWVGGVCFLLGALFLIPEELSAEEASAHR